MLKKVGKNLSDDQIDGLRKKAKAECAKREREGQGEGEQGEGNRLAQEGDADVLEKVKREVKARVDDLSPEQKRELADAICRKVRD